MKIRNHWTFQTLLLPSWRSLGLMRSIWLHFDFNYFKRIYNNGFSYTRSKSSKWVCLKLKRKKNSLIDLIKTYQSSWFVFSKHEDFLKLLKGEKLPCPLWCLNKYWRQQTFPEWEKSLLMVHLPGAVPHAWIPLILRHGIVLELKPCFDQVQWMHDHNFNTSCKWKS